MLLQTYNYPYLIKDLNNHFHIECICFNVWKPKLISHQEDFSVQLDISAAFI